LKTETGVRSVTGVHQNGKWRTSLVEKGM
jgi:hypothetical protein